MRILVTGASGFIGGALARRLVRDGHRVRGLARSEPAASLVSSAGADPLRGDITRPGPWQDELRAEDAVVHAAAMVSDWGPRQEFLRTNVGGTRHVLEALHGWPGHLVFISSIAVHGWRPGVYAEDTPATPGRHPYSFSKAAAEALVEESAGKGLRASIVRVAGVYGPGDPHFAARLIDYAASGHIPVIGRGDQPSKLIYIDDAVEALAAILDRAGGRYLLNDPAVPNVEEMVRLAAGALGLTVKVRHVPEWLGLAAAFVEETRARLTGSPPALTSYAVKAMSRRCHFLPHGTCRTLGWSPTTAAPDGVAQTVSWFRSERPMSPGARPAREERR